MGKSVAWVSENALAFLFFVVIVGLFGLIVWITKYLIERDRAILAANAGNSERIPFSAMFVMIILGGTVFVGLLAWIFQPTQESASNGFGTLAGLILLGMVVFIGIMNILTLSAARIGMLDGRQPFGLPEGSVRAILTIAFIVLVGVLSSFLLTGSNNRTGYASKGTVLETQTDRMVAENRASEIRKTYGANALIAIEQTEPVQKPDDQKQKTQAQQGEGQQADAQKQTETTVGAVFKIVIYPKVDNSVADDISKQTLTMVSTILAAMIGFYFATRSDAGAADPASVERSNAQKRLRELLKETKPNKAVAGTRDKLAAYAKLAEEKHAGDTQKQKQAAQEIKAWEAKLAGFDSKLETAGTVSENDKAAYSEIDTATKGIRSVNNELEQLQKDISDKHKVLTSE